MILQRIDAGDAGTFGHLVVPAGAFFTLELPPRDNAPNASCIPAGTYGSRWTYSPHLRRFAYLLGPVDGRAGIRVHSANLAGDKAKGYRAQLNGCIALGERLGYLDGQRALLLSAPAVRRFESWLAGQPFTLEIRDA